MQRNRSETKEHEDLITMMVRHFENQGFRNIKADIASMPQPDVIKVTKQNHIPDLTADRDNIKIILEAETSSTIIQQASGLFFRMPLRA